MRFQDVVVVVTGGASGIGLATAKAFAAEGAKVAVTDIRSDSVEDAVADIQARAGSAMGLVGDVGDPDVVGAHAEEVVRRFGKIDVLINNAGIIRRAPPETLNVSDWKDVISANLDGVFFWSQAVATKSMIPRKSGVIVNVASLAGTAAIPNAASYVATKHAVVGLTRALAIDWGLHGIRVNAICPGMTWSNLSKADAAANPRMFDERINRVPMGRAADPIEQARVILFLASAESSYVTGAVLATDGGQIALSSGHRVRADIT